MEFYYVYGDSELTFTITGKNVIQRGNVAVLRIVTTVTDEGEIRPPEEFVIFTGRSSKHEGSASGLRFAKLNLTEDANERGEKVFYASGDLSNATATANIQDMYLRHSVSGLTCSGAGRYVYQVYKMTDHGPYKEFTLKELIVEVLPGFSHITNSGLKTGTHWLPGDVIILTCTGSAGSLVTMEDIAMIWESSDAHGDFYPIPQEHENSTTYTDLQLFSLHDGCYHEAVSVLTMQLTVNDSGNSMRCYIQNSYVNHSSVQTAAVYSIGLVKNYEEKDDIADNKPESSSSSTSGKIMGIVLGVIIADTAVAILSYPSVVEHQKKRKNHAGAFPECVGNTLITPDRTTIQVRSSGQGRAGIGRSSWKGLTRDATRRLRSITTYNPHDGSSFLAE